MESTDIPRLAYLVILLAGVGGYYIYHQRGNLGQMAKYAVIWGGIFLAFLVVVMIAQSLGA